MALKMLSTNWFIKNFPFLFLEAPDGSFHFRVKTYYIYEDNDQVKTKKLYFFKNKIVFILEEAVWNLIDSMRSDFYIKSQEYINKQKIIELVNEEKDKRISDLEENFRKIEISKNLLEDAYGENLGEVIKLKTDISNLEGRIQEKDIERIRIEEWFNEEINKREENIKSLREIINNFRNDIKVIIDESDKNTSEDILKLRKEFEMLDRDFVDVAKAMKVYSKDEERPKRGFRIKLD